MNLYKSVLHHQWLLISRDASSDKKFLDLAAKGLNYTSIECILLILGLYMFPVLRFITKSEPLVCFSNLLPIFLIIDLLIQSISKLNTPSFLPYLNLNVSRKKLVNCILARRVLSLFNLSFLILFVPVAIKYLLPVYGLSASIQFIICMILMMLNITYASLMIKLKPKQTISSLLILSLIFLGIKWMSTSGPFLDKPAFLNFLFKQIYVPIILIIIVVVFIKLCMFYLIQSLYQDATYFSNQKIKSFSRILSQLQVKSSMIYLNICLIWRNRRPRGLLTGTIFLLIFTFIMLGIFSYYRPGFQELNESESWLLLMVFIIQSAGFVIFEGLFSLLFYSSFFEGLMTRPVRLNNLFHTQYWLFISSIILLSLISAPLLLVLKIKILVFIMFTVYNIGVNSVVVLFLSTFNIAKADLNKSIYFNYEGYGFLQYFAIWAVIIIPAAIYRGIKSAAGSLPAVALFIIISLTALAFHRQILSLIIRRFKNHKYRAIALYNGTEE